MVEMTSLPAAPLPGGGLFDEPYLTHRDLSGTCRSWPMTGTALTVGRAPEADVVLDGDPLVSRLHLTLERIGRTWTVVDGGLSRNGTFVNGRGLVGRVQLRDRDQIRAGRTLLTFCWPGQSALEQTLIGEPLFAASRMTTAQLAVLVALCRPCTDRQQTRSTPATNHEIAEELVLSVDAVKTHLRGLYHLWGIEQLPQNQKRARLAEIAQQFGLLPVQAPWPRSG